MPVQKVAGGLLAGLAATLLMEYASAHFVCGVAAGQLLAAGERGR